jgi:hypothetical protein
MPKVGGTRVGAGRKRKPTELRVLEGTFDKKIHGVAPPVQGGYPDPPAELTEEERALWETFPKPAWIGQTDAKAVHGAVATYAAILRNHKAQQATPEASHPLSYKYTVNAAGVEVVEAKENPLITQEIKLWGRLMSILGTLGLTPADRAKMTAPKASAVENKWEGIL